jgi:uncharacterized membrane protein YsdA (DUF1294 family)
MIHIQRQAAPTGTQTRTVRELGVNGLVLGTAGLFVLHVLGFVRLPWLLTWYMLLSLIMFALFAEDKRRSRQKQARPAMGWLYLCELFFCKRLGGWPGARVSERWLHLCELLGGWPGAMLAQYYFRHKSRKAGYCAVLRAIAGLHIALWGLWVLWH